jgi:hypothetical protein
MSNDYPIAKINKEDIQKIIEAEQRLKTAGGKDVILIAYEGD